MKIIPYLISFFAILISGLAINNILTIGSTKFNIFIGVFFIVFYVFLLGYIFFYKYNLSDKLVGGIIVFVAGISIIGTFFYYFKNLKSENIAITIILLSVIILLVFLYKYFKYKPIQDDFLNLYTKINNNINKIINENYSYSSIIIIILLLFYCILGIKGFIILADSQFSEATRSLWNYIPRDFFYIYIINTFLILILSLYNRANKFLLIFVGIHYFFTLSIALIVYKIGYGFDPFIHRATEEVIFYAGEIVPKTFYYIGQYSIVVIFAKLLGISTNIVDLYLVPILYSALVPWSIYFYAKHCLETKKNYAIFASIFGLFIPLGFYITTTPQSLANIFLIILIFLAGCVWYRKLSPILLIILVISSVAIHPLGGIPGFIFLLFILLHYFFQRHKGITELIRKSIFAELFIVSSLLIPLVFVITSYISNGNLKTLFIFDNIQGFWTDLLGIAKAHLFLAPNRYILEGDLIYGFANFHLLLIFIIATLGIILAYKKRKLRVFGIYFLTFFALIINYLLLLIFISFEGVIEYERNDYALRIYQMSFYFLLPILIYAIIEGIKKAKKINSISIYNFIIFLIVIGISTSMYVAYPREDGYVYSKGYNISQSDLSAVYFINNDAQKNNINSYIVLSNQSTSAIALREFGFDKYYEIEGYGEIFYYPVPTSSPLYQYYLDMVYQDPSREIIQNAAEFMNVNTVYFVINKYWAKSREIISASKKIADSWTSLDNEQIYVFKFIIK